MSAATDFPNFVPVLPRGQEYFLCLGCGRDRSLLCQRQHTSPTFVPVLPRGQAYFVCLCCGRDKDILCQRQRSSLPCVLALPKKREYYYCVSRDSRRERIILRQVQRSSPRFVFANCLSVMFQGIAPIDSH